MKKYIAILTATSTSKEIMTINADDHDEALELAAEIADELTEEGVFYEDDMMDVDVYELNDVPDVSTEDDHQSQTEHTCAKVLSKIVRLIRNTDDELSDEAMARVLLNGMTTGDEE